MAVQGMLASLSFIQTLISDVHDLFKQVADGGGALRRRNVLTVVVALVMAGIGPVGAVTVNTGAAAV